MARKYDHEYKVQAVKPAKEIGGAKMRDKEIRRLKEENEFLEEARGALRRCPASRGYTQRAGLPIFMGGGDYFKLYRNDILQFTPFRTGGLHLPKHTHQIIQIGTM